MTVCLKLNYSTINVHVCFVYTILLYSYVQSAGPALETAVSLVTGIHGPFHHNGAMHGTAITNTDATSTDATTTSTAGVTYSREIDDVSPKYIRDELGFSSEGTTTVISVTCLCITNRRTLITFRLTVLNCARISLRSFTLTFQCTMSKSRLYSVCAK
jgi:hypothetical protein